MEDNFEYFQVSQAGVLISEGKCLIVRFSGMGGKYWDIPGGRIDKGEYSEEAFRREMKEELDLEDFKILGLVDYDIWYIGRQAVCAVAFLIESDKKDIVLSDEHVEYKWIERSEIKDYNFLWPNAKRMLKKAFEYKHLLETNEK